MAMAGLPCAECSDLHYTDATAVAKAEDILRAYLSEAGYKRSEFAPPFVELANGDALVYFRLLSSSDESIMISLGKDGSVGIAPNIPSRDLPRER
jgi:hypothetical protein